MQSSNRNSRPQPGLAISIFPLLTLACLLAFNVYVFGDEALGGAHQVALLLAGGLTAALAMRAGISWDEVQGHIVSNIKVAIPAILILLIVGSLSGTWMISGIVPSMIYYGLHILNHDVFLFAACLIAAVVSLATGSSWSTTATIGIALMGTGRALGISEGMVAGAIISGAYFGDKLSPLSDTTNLAAGVGGTDLFTHIRYMTLTTFPSISLALLAYLAMGIFGSHDVVPSDHEALYSALRNRFNLNPLLMGVPIAVLVMIVSKVPALPALFVGVLLGAISAFIFQPDIIFEIGGSESALGGYRGIMTTLFGSTAVKTGAPQIDELLTTSGMAGMLSTIWLIVSAMVFGGTMESAGYLDRITSGMLSHANTDGRLIAATASTSLIANVTASDQYLAIVVPGRMFATAYSGRGLAPENLSRTLEDAGTVTSVLVPWNTCGAYQASLLGVATLSYAPFAFFCLLSPLMTIGFGYRGHRIARR